MAFQLRNSPEAPGHALLVFDRVINADQISISVLNRMSRRYLGPSVPGKTNWTTARSHFFAAARVSVTDKETVFEIGPEITTFIPEETMIEFATRDDTIKEEAPWRGISMFGWTGPPSAVSSVSDTEVPALPVIVSRVDKPASNDVVQTAPQAHMPATPQPTGAGSSEPAVIVASSKRSNKKKWVAGLWLVLAAVFAAYFFSTNPKACLATGIGCKEELVFANAQLCAAAKTCGGLTCTEEYRRLFPAGRFRSQIASIDEQKGGNCERVAGNELKPLPALPQLQPLPPQAPPPPVQEAITTTVLSHNGSTIEMRTRPDHQVEMRYKVVRSGLPAEEGAVLFHGTVSDRGEMNGVAYIFKRGCAPAGYDVSGRQSNSRIVLTGAAPIHPPGSCGVARYDDQNSNARLEFTVAE
jgi:hypothetical protein